MKMKKSEFEKISAAAEETMRTPLQVIHMEPLAFDRGIVLDEETFKTLEPFFFAMVKHTYEIGGLVFNMETPVTKGNVRIEDRIRILPFKDESEHNTFCVDLRRLISLLEASYKKISFEKFYAK